MATTLCLASPMIKAEPKLPGEVNAPGLHAVSVENNSDCLLIGVTVMYVEFKEDGTLKEMDLYFGEWLEPGQKATLYVADGDYYIALVEAFFWDPDTKKATAPAGQQYKEGLYDHTKPKADRMDIRCIHTELKEA